MPTLKSDLVSRVDRLTKPTRTSEALQPMFEAVSNAIHAVRERLKETTAADGRVDVYVSANRAKDDVEIIVSDNGIGLNDENFDAFLTTDTPHKIRTGGKGVGRLYWMDCFEKIHVKSVFEQEGSLLLREFDFVLSDSEQLQNFREEVAPSDHPIGTTVTFRGLRDNGYKGKFPGRLYYLEQHFASHLLPIFVGGNSPLVALHYGDQVKLYPRDIQDFIYRQEQVSIEVEPYGRLGITLLECNKVLSANLDGTHLVHFIAHGRTVESQSIDGKLGFKAFGDERDRVFQACVFGDFLDENVNQDRTGFVFEDVVLDRIVNDVCMPLVEAFIAEPLGEHRATQQRTIATIAAEYPSVRFGPIESLQDFVPLGEVNDDAIYGHLARERFRRDQRQALKIQAAFSALKSEDYTSETLNEVIAEAAAALEAAEERSLAEYVVRRKAVLDFLEILLDKVRAAPGDSAYQQESVLHSLICPMRVQTVGDSPRMEPASHDLWVIDERLTFAQFFASDARIADLVAGSADQDRPDLLIFDQAFALRTSDQSPHILLVEFKRPGRRSYRDDENPVQQVERYVRSLLEGGEVNHRGRPLQIDSRTIFYCFIVADIVGKMDEWTYSWERTPDGRGRYYQARSGFTGSIEVMGWDSVLADAKLRNAAFFDAAGLPDSSLFDGENSSGDSPG